MMKQCTVLVAKADFSFRSGETGRPIRVRQSDRFETLSTAVHIQAHQTVQIAREGRGRIGGGYLFSLSQIADLFNIGSR